MFLSQWRNNVTNFGVYKSIARQIAKELNVSEIVNEYDETALRSVMTFEETDQRIIRNLRDSVMSSSSEDNDDLKELTSKRKDGFWASPRYQTSGDKQNIYFHAYDAIESASGQLHQ